MIEDNFASRQSLGSRRNQEDSCGFYPVPGLGLLAVLADGMGGYQAGEVASEIALRSFVSGFERGSGRCVRDRLRMGLDSANADIAAMIRSDPGCYGSMGTTLVGALASPAGIEWISVGDSPLFLWSRRLKVLRRLNEDHSMAPEITKEFLEGNLTNAEVIQLARRRNSLRSAVIGEPIELIDDSDGIPRPFEEGDILILASDGVLSLVHRRLEQKVEAHARQTAGHLAEAVLDAVKGERRKDQDNASVLVVHLGPWLGSRLSC